MRPSQGRTTAASMLLASAVCIAILAMAVAAPAQTTRPSPAQPPTTRPTSAIPPELAGQTVVEVRLVGRTKPLSTLTQSEIAHQIRTQEGDPLDPATVEADYQRIFGLRRFSNVEARVEPTDRGVIVIFEVSEQNTIKEIRFRGNKEVDTKTLMDSVSLKAGESIDPFRISLARDTMERIYRDKNYTYAHVTVDQDELTRSGVLVFNIVEGPHVRVRKVRILGNRSFTNGRIKGQIKTKSWFPFFVSGRFDPDQIEQDVASIRQFYENKGFFDVRVGRKVIVGPTQAEVMVDFLIEEGPRYLVSKVSFRGNASLDEEHLRQDLKLQPGMVYDQDLVKRDIRQIVKAYSPLGYIYVPQDPNPSEDYLRIRDQRFFQKEPGKVEVVYDIHEGRPFKLGRIIVKGNEKTQDKVILREMRVEPGRLYNSAEIQTATDRIRATNLFTAVTMTPIGEDPSSRDLLVEVTETQTARFMIGAGVSSNSGILGNITYEQKNFDITNWPSGPGEALSNRAFTGAGQTFRLSLEPGTEISRARVDFIEPWIFDQPYRFGASAYLSQRLRRNWIEGRAGGRLSLGKRFNDVWSGTLSLRAEDVVIDGIRNEELRAPEVLEARGHHTITSLGPEIRRDTTDSPIFPTRGTVTVFGWEHYGALGGEADFEKFSLGWNGYTTIYEDLLERRTVLALRADAGYITGGAPFFERLYAGGIGSLRGFRYRGVSPRSGIDEDPIGGDFSLTGSVEVNFPLAGDALRGVVFTDAGTVEEDMEIGTIRTAAGFGFRITLPFFGQLPIAVDFAIPITKDDQDDTRIFSFSLGMTQ